MTSVCQTVFPQPKETVLQCITGYERVIKLKMHHAEEVVNGT